MDNNNNNKNTTSNDENVEKTTRPTTPAILMTGGTSLGSGTAPAEPLWNPTAETAFQFGTFLDGNALRPSYKRKKITEETQARIVAGILTTEAAEPTPTDSKNRKEKSLQERNSELPNLEHAEKTTDLTAKITQEVIRALTAAGVIPTTPGSSMGMMPGTATHDEGHMKPKKSTDVVGDNATTMAASSPYITSNSLTTENTGSVFATRTRTHEPRVDKTNVLMSKSWPKFDGRVDYLQSWLVSMENFFDALQIDEDKYRMLVLVNSLEKPALDWYNMRMAEPHPIQTWVGFKREIQERFVIYNGQEKLRGKLNGLSQRESIDAYIQEFRTIIVQVHDMS